MNAALTWWGVSIAILNHSIGNEVLSRETLIKVVPVFVAVMVWLIRILIIGTFSVAGDRLFSQSDRRTVLRSVTNLLSARNCCVLRLGLCCYLPTGTQDHFRTPKSVFSLSQAYPSQ
jgi:hypothetical protein